jgi:hypothetical protein
MLRQWAHVRVCGLHQRAARRLAARVSGEKKGVAVVNCKTRLEHLLAMSCLMRGENCEIAVGDDCDTWWQFEAAAAAAAGE